MSLTAAALTSTDPRYMNDAWMRRNTGAWAPMPGPDGQVQYNDPAWQERQYSFRDVLESVNPLQHIPVVGHLYRQATGTQLHPIARMAAGIAGGPVSTASAFANMALESGTGRDLAGHILDRVTGRRVEHDQTARGSYVYRPVEGAPAQRNIAPDASTENMADAGGNAVQLAQARPRGVTAPMPAGVIQDDAAPAQAVARAPRARPPSRPAQPAQPVETVPQAAVAQAANQGATGGIPIVGARVQEASAPTGPQRVQPAAPVQTIQALNPANRAAAAAPVTPATVQAAQANALATQFSAAQTAGRGRSIRDYLENAAARDIQAETPRMPIQSGAPQALRHASFGFTRPAAAATAPRAEQPEAASEAPAAQSPTTPAQISAAAQAAGAMQVDRANLAATMMRNLERYRTSQRNERNEREPAVDLNE